MAEIAPLEVTLIDSLVGIVNLVNDLAGLPADPPSLYLDLEGTNLSRTGTASILTILIHRPGSNDNTYLVDLKTLGSAAFTTANISGKTLASILESPTAPKVFFDVRNDSDALHYHFGICLRGVVDIQLLENASRSPQAPKRLLHGLKRCIEHDLYFSPVQRNAWKAVKYQGRKTMDFDERPLSEAVRTYCAGDVRYMPRMWQLYSGRLEGKWNDMVADETERRVELSQSPGYEPHGRHKVLGPWEGGLPTEELWTPPTRGDQS